jgi:diaminopimelate decarboxylase
MNSVIQTLNLFEGLDPAALIQQFGGPLYVYNERVLRKRCQEMKQVMHGLTFKPNYSVKANTNVGLLKVIKEEGLNVDCMSPGEILFALEAGFHPDDIFYISNNVDQAEMQFAIDRNITLSIDSLSQLEMYGALNPGGKVAVRFNPMVGAGHHEKVITGGKKTKFGVDPDKADAVKDLLSKYKLTLVGINQHIGSLFLDGQIYVDGVQAILEVAKQFEHLEFVDLGGGFGIPYNKLGGELPLDLTVLSDKLSATLLQWQKEYGKEIAFKTEPGRFVVCESGMLVGTVHAIKDNSGLKFIGTDLGFNILMRPVMYDAHHDIEIVRNGVPVTDDKKEIVTVVGNICESGDIIAKDRALPVIFERDTVVVLDAGAYGSSMSSNYNMRLRPAEILIKQDGTAVCIRRADTFEDLLAPYRAL